MNDTVVKLLGEWGLNAVRLGTMWAGVEPQKGQYNETYLEITGDIIRRLEDNGIDVILDAHQDVISSAYGSYDGVPRWLIDSFPAAKHPYPWPLKKVRFWAEGYITQAVGNAFQSIYDNKSNARDAFASFWKKLASTFNSTAYPNVLGYELINEPWAGDIYSHPALLLPGVAGRRNLLPLYDAAVDAIRSVESNALVFYEPVTWSVMKSGRVLGTGFTRVPGSDNKPESSVLSFHYYCWLITPQMGSKNDTVFLKTICDKRMGPNVFKTIDEDLAKTGGSSFLTEFGICQPDGNPDSISTVECNVVLDLCDQHMQSWAYWDAAFFDGEGNPRWSVVKAFSRPFARAVAGIPQKMHFNRQDTTFELQYSHWKNITAPTEIFVPPLHYTDGFHVTITDGVEWKYDSDLHVVTVSTPSSRSDTSATIDVTINITPK